MQQELKEKWRNEATLADALSHGLTEEEFNKLTEILGRKINVLELGVSSALYSEHCSYKSTRLHLKNLPSEGAAVLQGPGENAGVIDIGDGQAIVFKIESHNHPSFIEPFQGAATGVGGILRDVFTMGARPLALMNALRFGASDNLKTGYLLRRAVAGIGTYGNCVGVPTVGGELYFHKSYNGNCLVNAFALGLVNSDEIFLGRAAGTGNPIIYAGSKTGRDGIHGATMASEEFSEDSAEKLPTVQVGDPFQEKLLIEACLEAMKTGAIVGIQDMGAAGMTSSSYEMAERAGTGLKIDLSLIPQREKNMNPYEIMLSESQERMLLVVEAGKENQIIDIFKHWELEAVQIGQVIEGGNVELCWKGEIVSSLPATLLTSSVPKYRWPEKQASDYDQKNTFDPCSIEEPQDLSAVWLKMLASVNLCSRHQVYQQYDSTVRTNTVVQPGGDAAVIRVKNQNGSTEKGLAMTLDCNSLYCSTDPRQGAALSVAEAYRNISAVGALPLGISDCLNYGSPQKPEGMWQIAEGIRGLAEAARAFSAPVISGNVSLYNETNGKAILPTPMIAMVGLLPDASKALDIYFKNEGDMVFLIGNTDCSELGTSQYLSAIHGIEMGALPALDYRLETSSAELIRALINERLLQSCHDVSQGGLAIALSECCFKEGSFRGVTLSPVNPVKRGDGLLFSESGARYIVSCKKDCAEKITRLASQHAIPISAEGVVGGDAIEITGLAKVSLKEAYQAFSEGLSQFYSSQVLK
jgi:phosphoribosylformylglycinamidine synthase